MIEDSAPEASFDMHEAAEEWETCRDPWKICVCDCNAESGSSHGGD